MRIGDRIVNDVEPKDRDIAMVFQNYALYPHMSVYDNIGFALKLPKVPKAEIDARVRKAAAILELEDLPRPQAGRSSPAASASAWRWVGRSSASRPPSSWTSRCRTSTPSSACRCAPRSPRCSASLAVTTVYVTHDQIEAMTMGDRVAVLKDGYLQQVDTPQNLYDHPVNVFVAAFIGSPSMNLFEADVRLSGDAGTVTLGSHTLGLDPECLVKHPKLRAYDGKRVIVGIRPEDYEDAALAPQVPESQRITSNITLVEALGSELMAHFRLDATTVDSGDPDAVEEKAGVDTANAVGRFARGHRPGSASRSRSPSPRRTCTSSTSTPARASRATISPEVRLA